jgi:hypothetical protein
LWQDPALRHVLRPEHRSVLHSVLSPASHLHLGRLEGPAQSASQGPAPCLGLGGLEGPA